MNKRERISEFVQALEGKALRLCSGQAQAEGVAIADHPYYRAFFHCWNEHHYYEAHDVLEQVWLDKTISREDAQYFKGLIQAAGAFVHLQKQFEHPTHPKHGRRLGPAVRLFQLAEKNLAGLGRRRHGFNLVQFREMLARHTQIIVESGHKINPWSPENAPQLKLSL